MEILGEIKKMMINEILNKIAIENFNQKKLEYTLMDQSKISSF